MALPSKPTASFPYEIEDTIGQGSMGRVYRARETSLDRTVAIKTLRPDFVEELDEKAAHAASRRFLQEARAIARLSHPGIVSIYRLGTEESVAYIAMEWLEGRTLAELLADEAPTPVERACHLVIELLDIVQVAHKNDIVHRDLKPENVIVSPAGELKLNDFGVAHVADSKLVKTAVGSIVGTPLYAAPEQLDDGNIDPRSDLYAIGVLFYEMLTGRRPFDSENLVSLITDILKKEAPPASSVNPAVPKDLAALIDRALAKDKRERFSSANQMRTAIESHLNNQNIALTATRPTSNKI
ncbi:MAG: serine/threonine-protein kinase [Persicimonas sp.]